jgi:uncharacterized membrane protein YvbJ
MVKPMPYCPKCGVEVKEEMDFCPQCGASLKPLPARMEKAEKEEKREKEEKGEKAEKTEKHEKRESGYVGPLVGGVILIIVGIMLYLATVSPMYMHDWGPVFLIMVGIIILIFGLYATLIAAKRSPRPP